ncbi:aldehyde dehydrogenase family protein [Microbacterium sp. X-17]|uniref:aldehyde dehydrogenase family protein n=1 Tax=Microbacterium sp. X-17 TaxID=3144404 RepID=UPI0031F4AB16
MSEQTALQTAYPAIVTRGDLGHFIDGGWHVSDGERLDTWNPATGEVLTTLARGTSADVDRAVASSRRAFEGPWSRFTPYQRQMALHRLHDLVDAHWEELCLIESLDVGVPLARMHATKDWTLRLIAYFASQATAGAGETLPNSMPGNFTTMTLKAPVGVVGGIIPWNGPLMSEWWIVAAALATGCTAVMKPAEDASLSVLRTAELVMEAGVPAGVVNVVTGLGREAGAALAAHPDVDRIAFTGSTETGREIIRASAVNMKRLQLELGGKSPDIVFADADLDVAVPGAAMGVFANSGQVCFAGTRVFVQRSIQDEFVARMAEFTRQIRVGDPLDLDTQLGPLISDKQLERVMGYVDIGGREGAELVVGGRRMGGAHANGFFVEPTIFSQVSNDMRIAREEIFGPVISVIPFDTAEDALRLANDTVYGLGGAVWSRDVGTVNTMVRGIQAGMVWVNCYGITDPSIGFGGYKQSGYGWKGGPQHIEGFLYQKAVYINGD